MSIENKLEQVGATNQLKITDAQNEITAQLEDAKENALRIRRPNTEYQEGDKVNALGKENFDFVLQCVQAGTTADRPLGYGKLEEGQTIADGTAAWKVIPAVTINNTMVNELVENKVFNTSVTQITAPAGLVFPFAGFESNIPDGYLLCDGAIVSRTEYSALFRAIGTIYGAGDGLTTFRLPDFRGSFLRGKLYGVTEPMGTKQEDSIKAHTHDMKFERGTYTGESGGTTFARGYSSYTQTKTTEETGGTETRPVNYAINWIIKT